MKPFTDTSPTTPRRQTTRTLPLFLLAGALLLLPHIAHAQDSGATQQPGVAGFLSQLFSGVGAIAMLALIIGYFRPQMFAFLFKDKTTKGRVCGTFGAAMLVFGLLGSSLEPKAVVTPQEMAAKSAQAKAEDAARVAQENAKAAEARADKAEKDAAAANAAVAKASTKSATGQKGNSSKASAPPSPEAAQAVSGDAALPDNVTVENIPGVGKRQVGVVDEVAYTIVSAQTTKTLGSEVFHRDADGMFFVLHVGANNTDKETHDANTTLIKLVDDQDREFDPSTEGGAALAGRATRARSHSWRSCNPGLSRSSPSFSMRPKMPGASSSRSRQALALAKVPRSKCPLLANEAAHWRKSEERRPESLGRRSSFCMVWLTGKMFVG